MNELSLFSGGGGGILASRLLGWTTIGYVEKDSYCQQVIAARAKDGYIDEAPIFGDIREFIQSGAAREYRGLVDVVSGGFPCQPFSVAGKRKGEHDKRNLWPETIECIRTIRPRFAFLENVPRLSATNYFTRIIGDLTEAGYDCRWAPISAAQVGAPHLRKRLWIVAHSKGGQDIEREPGNVDEAVQGRQGANAPAGLGCEDVAHSDSRRRQQCDTKERQFPELNSQSAYPSWWQAEPEVGRVVDGMANRVAQLRALGNGQVPLCAAVAFRFLAEE
jgi:DNA (cytosine-5)-methyltransferase 1